MATGRNSGKKVIVKNLFGLVQIIFFQLSIIYKSYRQVQTPVHNFQLLLKLQFYTSSDLKHSTCVHHKETTMYELVYTGLGEVSALMTLIHDVPF